MSGMVFKRRPWNLHINNRDHPGNNQDGLQSDCLCWPPNFTPPKMALIEQGDSAPPENCHRLVLLGSSKVGKTSLASRFLYNKFDDNYTPTIEDFHRKIYRIKGEAYRLDILDTSGNHPFPAMRRLSIITGDLFILVYSIDNRESFEEVSKLCQQIQESKSQCRKQHKKLAHVPIMIVGNKCDKEKNRVIDPSEPEILSESYHHSSFIEASAKKDINVEESFQQLFDLAKLPMEMSPSLHRRVQPTYVSGASSQSSKRGMSIRRKMSDACGTIAPNVRRPSIRTDLLVAQMRTNATKPKTGSTSSDETTSRESRCVIQ